MRPRQPATSPHRQRGIAILTTLVIAVLIVTLAAVIFARQSRAVRQTDDYQSLERAWQYAYSIEQFAGMELQRDAKSGDKSDDLTEDWAINLPTLPLEEGNGVKVGEFNVKLEDLQARFNINSIMDDKGKESPNQEMTTLKNLAQSAGLPATFADTIFDWMDPDSIIRNGSSAETDYYLSGAIPYRAADIPLVDASEIRLLRLDMMDPEQKDKALKAFLQNVTVLPFNTTVNANTTNKAVLQAMGLNADRIKIIMDARLPENDKPFKSAAQLFADLQFDTNTSTPAGKADAELKARLSKTLDVSSSFFRLKGEVKVGRARVFLNSVFYREPGQPIRVIMRQFDRVDENEPETTTTTDDASTTPTNS